MATKAQPSPAEILAGLAALLGTEVPGTDPEPAPAKGKTGAKRQPGTKRSKRQQKGPWYEGMSYGLSKHSAWLALGADDKYEPKSDPDAPASPAQLNALNLAGSLTVK